MKTVISCFSNNIVFCQHSFCQNCFIIIRWFRKAWNVVYRNVVFLKENVFLLLFSGVPIFNLEIYFHFIDSPSHFPIFGRNLNGIGFSTPSNWFLEDFKLHNCVWPLSAKEYIPKSDDLGASYSASRLTLTLKIMALFANQRCTKLHFHNISTGAIISIYIEPYQTRRCLLKHGDRFQKPLSCLLIRNSMSCEMVYTNRNLHLAKQTRVRFICIT